MRACPSTGRFAPNGRLFSNLGLIAVLALGVGCQGLGGSEDDSSVGGLDDQARADANQPKVADGSNAGDGSGDGTMGDPNAPAPGDDGSGGCMNPGEPRPGAACFDVGGQCVLVDLATAPEVWCPPDLVPIELPCDQDPNTMNPTICCAFPGTAEPPPPSPVPRCEEVASICVPYDSSDPNVDPSSLCPEGTWPVKADCDLDPATMFPAVCCGRIEPPPGEPTDPGYPGGPKDPGQGGAGEPSACPDESSPLVFYVSYDRAVCNGISFTCPSNHVPFDSDCGCGCIGHE